jgi:hypothetical protein
MHFPAYVMGAEPGTTAPNTLMDALQAGGAKAPAEPWTTMPNIGAW